MIKKLKNIDRKIRFHFLHFPIEDIYRFCCYYYLFKRGWLLSLFFMVLQRALADVSNTSFSSF